MKEDPKIRRRSANHCCLSHPWKPDDPPGGRIPAIEGPPKKAQLPTPAQDGRLHWHWNIRKKGSIRVTYLMLK